MILLLVVTVPYFCPKVLIRFNTTLGRLKVRSNQMGTTPNLQVIGVIFNNIRLFNPLKKRSAKLDLKSLKCYIYCACSYFLC